jgi:hypothetical protein
MYTVRTTYTDGEILDHETHTLKSAKCHVREETKWESTLRSVVTDADGAEVYQLPGDFT